MANYHPNNEFLMSFAAGQLSNSLGIMIACHLEQCEQCRRQTSKYEALGGEILASIESQKVSPDLISQIMDKIDHQADIKPDTMPAAAKNYDIPRPLRRFVPDNFDDLKWSGMSRNIREYTIDIDDPEYTAKFYKIKAGKELPEHTHEGSEFTMVMSGSFSDRTCHYHRGDFILADEQTVHQPRASLDADCICFAVMDAPLKMTGFFGRMLNPFMR